MCEDIIFVLNTEQLHFTTDHWKTWSENEILNLFVFYLALYRVLPVHAEKKPIYNRFSKCFMYTVYKTVNEKC